MPLFNKADARVAEQSLSRFVSRDSMLFFNLIFDVVWNDYIIDIYSVYPTVGVAFAVSWHYTFYHRRKNKLSPHCDFQKVFAHWSKQNDPHFK